MGSMKKDKEYVEWLEEIKQLYNAHDIIKEFLE